MHLDINSIQRPLQWLWKVLGHEQYGCDCSGKEGLDNIFHCASCCCGRSLKGQYCKLNAPLSPEAFHTASHPYLWHCSFVVICIIWCSIIYTKMMLLNTVIKIDKTNVFCQKIQPRFSIIVLVCSLLQLTVMQSLQIRFIAQSLGPNVSVFALFDSGLIWFGAALSFSSSPDTNPVRPNSQLWSKKNYRLP